ncbi:MAG TPA: hypothetical protein VE131_06400, partial [Terriglobales bacterium]|nr:hypothetical protein [Terriglobales bacterium]
HLELTEELEHSGAGKLKFIRGPVKYEHLAEKKSTPPPLLGEHTKHVLVKLGYGQPAIEQLAREGAIQLPPD